MLVRKAKESAQFIENDDRQFMHDGTANTGHAPACSTRPLAQFRPERSRRGAAHGKGGAHL
jgi:hypothetical protein